MSEVVPNFSAPLNFRMQFHVRSAIGNLRDCMLGALKPLSLRLLEEWLTKRIRIHTKNGPAVIVAPLKEVRNLRHRPTDTPVYASSDTSRCHLQD